MALRQEILQERDDAIALLQQKHRDEVDSLKHQLEMLKVINALQGTYVVFQTLVIKDNINGVLVYLYKQVCIPLINPKAAHCELKGCEAVSENVDFDPNMYRGTHGLKSNRPNRVNPTFWQIDLANLPNSYLASHDLHSSPKEGLTILAPLLTVDS